MWLDFAAALRDLKRHEAAAEAVRRAIGLDDCSSGAWIRLGEIRLSLGQREQAADAFRRAAALQPDSLSALRGLSQAEDLDPESEPVRRMQALSLASATPVRGKAELHYTLAQIFRRVGRSDEFIHHLLAANTAQRTLCRDGRAQYEALFDRLEAAFTSEAFQKAARADAVHPAPLFVLGMPRSGTTLVEQLLGAHPRVTAGGEIDYMRRVLRRRVERETGRVFPEAFQDLSARTLNTLAGAFARRLELMGPTARYVVDKTPGNYHLLGLLRVLFPSGKIVHVTRDPMDTCFSILQHPFDDRSPHTCDMQLLAYVYARYARLMDQWDEMFPGEFITVQYERLVESPEEEGRRLFEYCELDWDASYLDFHRGGAAVRTFSATQVRRPIYKSSVGAWRVYADALAPLQDALHSELRIR